MTTSHGSHRRWFATAAGVAAVAAAVVAASGTATAVPGSDDLYQGPVLLLQEAGIGTSEKVASGDQDTVFEMSASEDGETPSLAFCPGGVADGYQARLAVFPATVDPGTATYPGTGPTGGAFIAQSTFQVVQPGLSTSNQILRNDALEGLSLGATFTLWLLGEPITPGDYWIVMSCTVADTSDRFASDYWASTLTLDNVNGTDFTWEVAVPGTGGATTTVADSTTTVATSTTVADDTTTTVATSTTVADGTTTTVATSTTVAGGATTTVGPGSGSATTIGSSSSGGYTPTNSGSLANTGSSVSVALLAAGLLLLGRLLFLTAQRVRVLPPR